MLPIFGAQCWIYFHHLDKYVYIPYFPESMQDSISSTFASTNALARTAPVVAYSYSGPRTVNFQLQFQREYYNKMNEDNAYALESNDTHTEAIDTLIRYLQAMCLPKYQAGSSKSVIPPMITVSIGGDIQIKGVINSNITIGYSSTIDMNQDENDYGKAHYNMVAIQFSVQEVDPYDAESVLNVGGFRPGILSPKWDK